MFQAASERQSGRRLILWLPLTMLFLLFAAPPARATHLVLDGRSGPYVEAYINGVPLRLRVDFDHSNSIALNGAAAARLGLGRGDGKWVEIIGPVKLQGRFAKLPVTIAGRPVRAKVNWRDMSAAADADGTISPHLLPFDRIVLQRRPPKPGERELGLPAKVHDNHGVHVPIHVGGREIAARLSFGSPRTTAPAAAAAVIGQHHGGRLGPRAERRRDQVRHFAPSAPPSPRPPSPDRRPRSLASDGTQRGFSRQAQARAHAGATLRRRHTRQRTGPFPGPTLPHHARPRRSRSLFHSNL